MTSVVLCTSGDSCARTGRDCPLLKVCFLLAAPLPDFLAIPTVPFPAATAFFCKWHKSANIHEYLSWLYSGAIIMERELSSPDHVSTILINPGKMKVLLKIFSFYQKWNSIYGPKKTMSWRYYIIKIASVIVFALWHDNQSGMTQPEHKRLPHTNFHEHGLKILWVMLHWN